MTIPLPESEWQLYMPAGPYESEWVSSETGYTEDDIKAYGEAMRREAMEEAAKVCETEAWRLKSIAVSEQSTATNSKSIGLSVAADKIKELMK